MPRKRDYQQLQRLRHRRDKVQQELTQLQRQQQKLRNQEEYILMAMRRQRTHSLCNLGGALLHFWPQLRELDQMELFHLCAALAQLPQVHVTIGQALEQHNDKETLPQEEG